MRYTIHQLPLSERPREKLRTMGADALTLAELIAVILGTGMKNKSVLELSHEILTHFGTLQNLADATVAEMQKIKGLGFVKALQLKAAITLGLKVSRRVRPPRTQILQPRDVFHYLKDQMENLRQEHFVVILLDVKGYVESHHTVTKGTLTSVQIHPREVFNLAVRHCAASVIVAHNHPSGDPTPSKEDIAMTQILLESGNILGIPLRDHIVIGDNSFVSIKESM